MKVRCKLGKRKVREVQRPISKPPSRLARQLALAYKIERMIESGELRNYAEAARRLGVSRARMTQVMNLLGMPQPDQEQLLIGPAIPLPSPNR